MNFIHILMSEDINLTASSMSGKDIFMRIGKILSSVEVAILASMASLRELWNRKTTVTDDGNSDSDGGENNTRAEREHPRLDIDFYAHCVADGMGRGCFPELTGMDMDAAWVNINRHADAIKRKREEAEAEAYAERWRQSQLDFARRYYCREQSAPSWYLEREHEREITHDEDEEWEIDF